MSQIFVISDWHLNHANILRYCPNRLELFRDVDDMNDRMVEAALETVGPEDTLFFLGDLTFQIGHKKHEVEARLRPLRDRVAELHWIRGNHDEPDRMPSVTALFDSVRDAHQIRIDGKHVFLSHYPLEVPWRDQLRLVSIHGHHHGSVDNLPGRVDVGVDSLYGIREHFDPGYTCAPIALEVALELAELDIPAPFRSAGQPRN